MVVHRVQQNNRSSLFHLRIHPCFVWPRRCQTLPSYLKGQRSQRNRASSLKWKKKKNHFILPEFNKCLAVPIGKVSPKFNPHVSTPLSHFVRVLCYDTLAPRSVLAEWSICRFVDSVSSVQIRLFSFGDLELSGFWKARFSFLPTKEHMQVSAKWTTASISLPQSFLSSFTGPWPLKSRPVTTKQSTLLRIRASL